MHNFFKLKITFCACFILLTTILIYKQMNNTNIAISKKQVQSEPDKVAIQAKSTKDCNVKLYQKAKEENEFTEVKSEEKQGILSTTNTFKIETKDKANPNNVTNIKSVVTDDYIIISFTPAKDEATLYEYYIETENESNDLSNKQNLKDNKSNITQIYSNFGIKGYNYIIDNSKETEAGFEVNKTNDEPILFTGIEWDKDYYLHIRAIDNSGNYSENITYKIDLPSKGVMLKYVDFNTNSEISPEETIIGVVNEQYDISTFNKNINGFELVGIDGETKGMLKKERINVKYNYAKKASIKIKYVDTLGNDILEPKIIEGYEGKEYNIYPKDIKGYICEVQNLSGKMTAGEEERIFTYNKLGTVNTSYVNEITGKNISNNVIITDIYGNSYKTEEKIIPGYELSKIDGETEGKIKSDSIKVTYYYKKQVNMVVKHIDITTNKLLDEEIISGLEGDKIEVESKNFDGYVLNIVENKDIINSENDLIKKALEKHNNEEGIDNSKIKEEESDYNSKAEENSLDNNLTNESLLLNNISNSSEKNTKENLENEKTNIVDEIISDEYEENNEITKDNSNSKLENYNIKQHYDIVLDPNEKEYIIYYKKK